MTRRPNTIDTAHESEAEKLQRLELAVSRLPRLQREILLALRLDDATYGDIAKWTGLSVQEVERQFARAMLKVHRQMCGERLRWWERWR